MLFRVFFFYRSPARNSEVAAVSAKALPYRRYTPEDDQRLIVAYAAGQALRRIAQQLGRTTIAVETRIKKLARAGKITQRRATGRPTPPVSDQSITEQDLQWIAYWRLPRVVRWNRNLQIAALNK